jgi:steroid delta-isomerase-like uncharacterized protein
VSEFQGLDTTEAQEFASRWLPAWTGGDPEGLLGFYAEDAFYSDPAIPAGVRGTEALRDYFSVLLGRFPDWVWTHRGSTPMERGFLNHWHAEIPVGGQTLSCDGVCTVQLRDGLIERNEVFFDRYELMQAIGTASGNG